MEGKKISFGFKLTKKAEKPVVVEEKKEFIECLEENSIKVIGGDDTEEKAPLIIPLKPNTLITADRLQQIAQEVEAAVQEPDQDVKSVVDLKIEPTDLPAGEETLEQMAVRELLEDAKKEIKVEVSALTVPMPSLPKLEGQKESTLDDYESVPIQDFGLAMLRGMGWTPGKEKSKYKEIQVRPKGLGLGADKMVKQNQKKTTGNDNEKELTIIKNAFVKITAGKYSGFYGKVVSLDDDNGRVVVDISAKKETVSLSEFMMQPVTKTEFDKSSRVINADKYEEYKQREQAPEKSSKDYLSDRGNTSRSYDVKEQKAERSRDHEGSSNGRSERERDHCHRDSSSEDRARRKKKEERKRYSSTDSLGSLSESDRKHKSKKNSSDSDSSDSYRRHKKSKKHKSGRSKEGKRDIDKKRKGKKKRRDRDRSPNYKKHRK